MKKSVRGHGRTTEKYGRRTASVIALASLVAMSPAFAQQLARVPLVSDADAAPAIAKTFAEIRATGARPLNMHRAVANAPEDAAAYIGLAHTLRADSHVPRALRELVILRVLQMENGEYEFKKHTHSALACGVSQDEIAGLGTWQGSKIYSPKQRAVLGWVDGMATSTGPGPDSVAAMRAQFDPHAIVEITLTANFYVMSARTTRALDVAEEKATGPAPAVVC